MYIKVKVHTQAKETKVLKKSSDSFEIWVQEKPVEGRANRIVTILLASHFHIPEGKIHLVKGGTRPNKIFEVIP